MVKKFMLNPVAKMESPNDAEKRAWLRLSRTEGIGPITFYKLMQLYGTAQMALEKLPGMSRRGGRATPLLPPPIDTINREYDSLLKRKGRIITAACAEYPLALAATPDAPPVISIIGCADLLNRPTIAIVGARNASLTGRSMAEKLARDLGERAQIIASGLARGIDTAAHQGSLQSGTIAVVAGGIDVIYPEENQKLYEAIADQGLIIAESPFGQKPFAQSFPRRNRIVSGIAQAVIVVEATMRSGSLITARLAGEQGREVYAVPGHPLDPRAEGPNNLIREGATLVTKADDVLEGLLSFTGQPRNFSDSRTQQDDFDFGDNDDPYEAYNDNNDSGDLQASLLSALSSTPVTMDMLIRSTDSDATRVNIALLEMELAGRIKRHPGGRVSLIS